MESMQRSTEQLTRCSRVTLSEDIEKAGSTITTQTVSEKIMSVCRNAIRWIIFLDMFLALSMLGLLGILEFGVIPNQQIGFFCNDPKIAFKFMGDTISIGLLIGGSIVIPLIVMWGIEYTYNAGDSYDMVSSCAGSRAKQVWTWYGHYSTGIIILTVICDIMKILIGEPRPHFLDTCKPREIANCTDEYVNSYTCTNTIDSNWFVSDSSRSFPSGHAALSVFTTVFIVWYLQNRLRTRTLFLKPWLQCLICCWGVTCSLTRIGDNRHHWWDVLAGDAMGLLFGLFTAAIPCSKFYIEKNISDTFNEPIENGQIGFNDKGQCSIKKLLTSTSADNTEGRELRDISTSWKE